MCPDDLRCFLRILEQADQLARIAAPVDPYLELANIVDLVSKGAGRGRALLFENVRGSALPTAVNLYGSPERMSWALGTTDLESLAQRIGADLAASGETDGASALTVVSSRPEWQAAVINNPLWRERDHSERGLGVIPPILAWPADGGAYMTLPQVYTRDPDGGNANCGMYRIQCMDSHTATIRWRAGSGAARHAAAWHGRGMAMPVAIALGGPPILAWAAAATLPDGVDEIALSGYLRQSRVLMSNCLTHDLLVPASAEIVIEGVVEPGATRPEGPFGNHTGSYDREAAAPVMKVLTVHARGDAIYPWTLVGPPPMENIQLARASACLLAPLVKMALPGVKGIHLPDEGIFHRAAVVTVSPEEARPLAEIAEILWSTPLFRGSRLLVIGAADHAPSDLSSVMWRMLNRAEWKRDVLMRGEQLAIDARHLPAGGVVSSDPVVQAKVLRRWGEFQLNGCGE